MEKGGLLVLFLLVAVLEADHQVIGLLDEHLYDCSRVGQCLLAGAAVQFLDMPFEFLLDFFEGVEEDVLVPAELLVLLQHEQVVDLSA